MGSGRTEEREAAQNGEKSHLSGIGQSTARYDRIEIYEEKKYVL